jgi:hypothetical protein
MDVTLIVNGLDLHERLSTYNVKYNVTYRKVVTTLDDTEHVYPGATKPVVTFSLMPMTDEESAAIYSALSDLVFPLKFTDPYAGADATATARVVSDLDATFALKSVDGKRRYKGGSIQLRGL